MNGIYLGCKHGIKKMKYSQDASIINNAAITGMFHKQENSCAYNSSKASIILHTKSVAGHCAAQKYNIRCNSVSPGPTETPMSKNSLKTISKEHIDRIVPIGRIGRADEVANTIVFLASELASYITGQNVAVDG